jgi:hypothetical protein
MMRWDSFGRSAAFAACAALGWIPWLVLGGPRALYLVAVTSAYVAGLGGSIARRLPAAILTAIAGGALLLTGDAAVLCVGLAVALAVARSAFLYRAAAARAVVVETALAGGGLVFARLLGARSPLGMVLAIWGFFLVQSFFFILAGVRVRETATGHPDAFEAAHARAMEVLERSAL